MYLCERGTGNRNRMILLPAIMPISPCLLPCFWDKGETVVKNSSWKCHSSTSSLAKRRRASHFSQLQPAARLAPFAENSCACPGVYEAFSERPLVIASAGGCIYLCQNITACNFSARAEFYRLKDTFPPRTALLSSISGDKINTDRNSSKDQLTLIRDVYCFLC